MIQTDLPIVPMPETGGSSTFWQDLKGMGLDEIIATLSNSIVQFAFKLLIAIAIFYAGRFLIRKLHKGVGNLMTRRNVDASLTTFVLSLVQISLYFILLVTVIGILGIETTSFLALFASAGVAVGMALSGTLQNFAGGVLILLLKPYKVGDFIEVMGYTGTVKSIQLFNTIINTVDNKAIIVPNGPLSTSSVNNYSLEERRRVDWSVSLAYGTDYKAAAQVLLAIVESDSRVGKEEGKMPFVGLSELGDSAIVFTLRAWTTSADYWPLYFDINERIYSELPALGFSFPFPQLDVHVATAE